MSKTEILEHIHALYRQEGIAVLSYPVFKRQENLYFHLYKKGLTLSAVIDRLGLRQEYDRYKLRHFVKKTAAGVQRRWSWDRVLREAKNAMLTHGSLPPAQWFSENGKGSLVQYVYSCGKSWEALRAELGSFETSSFVESRNGMRWRSHPEASVSNFLYARGIEHKLGERYADRFAQVSEQTRAWYDIHFRAKNGRWIDVEIWGDKPNGHDEAAYSRKRIFKERFHRRSTCFLGIDYQDCFSEAALSTILSSYIGKVEPFVFDRPTDRLIQTTHWSNTDELLETCRKLAAEQPDGLFPTEGWLRKRGRFRNRPGPVYNTVAIYVYKWFGGVRPLRGLLNETKQKSIAWDRKTTVRLYREFFETHQITPGQAKSSPGRSRLPRDQILLAQNICHAVESYVGGMAKLNKTLGIVIRRQTKWSRERVLQGFTDIHARTGLSPSQVSRLDQHRRKLFGVTKSDASFSARLCDRATAYFSSLNNVHTLAGIKVVDIRRLVQKRLNKTRT
jgi:hypothetical protein